MNNRKKFVTTDNVELAIKSNKKHIVFEIVKDTNYLRFLFSFDKFTYRKIKNHLEKLSYEMWSDFSPKEATSISEDYYTYYDTAINSNGYFCLIEDGFLFDRPSLDSRVLYKFNKKKMQSLLFDINKQNII